MILILILVATLTGMLLGLAAHMGERALRHLGWPTRFLWVVSMLSTVVLPLFLYIFGREIHTPGPTPVAALGALATGIEGFFHAEPLAGGLQVFERLVVTSWSVMSAVLLVGYVWVVVRSRGDERGWTTTEMDGIAVSLSPGFGPAVIGVRRSRIVLPRWVMALPPNERRLVLLHERQHLVAGDSRTLAVGALLVAGMPWNIPLWWQLRRLRLSLEVDCDGRVLRNGADRASYAELLLDLQERATDTFILEVPLSEPRSRLAQRIDLITRRPTGLKFLRASVNGAVAIALGGVALACTTLGTSTLAVEPTGSFNSVLRREDSPQAFFLTSDTGPPLLYVIGNRLYRRADVDLDTLRVASARLVKSDELLKQYGSEARNGVAYLILEE